MQFTAYNPTAFAPRSVTIITTIVYLALFIPLLIVHETVPSAPRDPILAHPGLNLTEAWLDLAELTNGYHPFNSRRNDEVRDWLLMRIGQILDSNGASWKTETAVATAPYQNTVVGEQAEVPPEQYLTPSKSLVGSQPHYSSDSDHEDLRIRASPARVVVFNDLMANFTSNALTRIGVSERRLGISTYFEGNNIIVYIRGSEDDEGEWWRDSAFDAQKTIGQGGVMVNAHFDSVSTGYGATDDGVAVITLLQLIKYFSQAQNSPKKGLVLLFNNGEEDGLYGAKAFLSHPMASFVHTFLNLEGAGAGGRATLFRATDMEVTQAYGKSRHPFGTVVSGDGFSLGFIRSETDYIIFQAAGYRGLDVAFWEPRARYHTDQDDRRHTSKDSLWHMLSASVATVSSLTSDTSKTFAGPRSDNDTGKVKNGKGSDGVWFDLFGEVLAVFHLRTLFAWSLALLIASPLILIVISYLLVRHDKYYFFAGTVKSDIEGSEPVSLQGWRGAFRFPLALIVASALVGGAAFLIRKFNPLIVYSSPYAVWTMSLSLFFIAFWFIMAGCNFVRPSALHRGYAILWLFSLGWLVLIAASVYEDRFKIASGYLVVVYESALFVSAVISLLELFALPTKSSVAEVVRDSEEARDGIDAVPHNDALVTTTANREDDQEPTETTPLVRGTTFGERYRQSVVAETNVTDGSHDEKHHVFGGEQKWSATLPSETWLLQFLLICPFTLVVLGQVGLLLVTALDQTGTDGGPLLLPYRVVTLFSVLLLLPLTPFIHRITHHIPTFLFLIFIGTLIYNLVAFPFSANNRYKAYFQQVVDLDTGINKVTLSGLEEYIRDIISYIPSAAGQSIECTTRPNIKDGLSFCSWEGLSPKVVANTPEGVPPESGFKDWLSYNVTRVPSENSARFHISGVDTRACIIRFESPFSAFRVQGAAKHGKFGGDDVPESGSDQIKLWHRDWDKEWVVDVDWPVSEGKSPGDEGREGRVVCLWSDHNGEGAIPALDEVQRFAPSWTSIVKVMDGLVEGSKTFVV